MKISFLHVEHLKIIKNAILINVFKGKNTKISRE